MDHKFQLFLLGVPEMVWQTRPFTLARRQARALLYCLAHELRPVPRDRLIFLLWPDIPETTARRNLTRLLSYTRQALPQPDLLLMNKTAVALNPGLVASDTAQFAELCATDDSTGWETAVPLYRSRFLDGFTLSDSAEFDQWLSQTQRQYERTYLDTLRKLVMVKADKRDHPAAIRYAQKYLAVDELAEEIHRHLISLYAANGDRSAALRQFEQCSIVLERELGVPPLPETRAAYEAARDGTPPPRPEMLPKPEWTTLPGLDLPLIGRDEAWQALTQAYRRYQNGGVIFISGEAGVGKSRLMQEFATAQNGLVLTGNSYATGQALPYQSLVQALRLALPLRDRWSHTLSTWLAEVSRLLPELRDHFPDLPLPVEVAPAQAQARLFEALTELFGSLAGNSPLLLCLDDVHWADEATLGWLEYTTNRLAGRGVCILATYRIHEAQGLAEWQRALSRAGHSASIRLTGLTETAVTNLLCKAGVDQRTAAPLATRIHAATDGNAFFVLETIRELLGTGKISDDAADLPLPQTVRAAVLRRAGRLTPLSQQMLTVAAVLSPHLRVDTLRQISGRSELETVDSLDELLAHQLLQADGINFRFQHDLARQAVYEEITLWRRRLLHRRAAEGLEQLHQRDLALFYPSLAHHWSRVIEDETADPVLVSRAIEYFQKAGEQAARNYANQEAIAYSNEAIALLKTLPDTPDRNQKELTLQMALGVPLMAAKGYAAPEAGEVFTRAWELCQQIGEIPQIFSVMQGLWPLYLLRAELQTAREVGESQLRLAQSTKDPEHLLAAHTGVGTILFWHGDAASARAHLEQGIALYDPQLHRSMAFQAGQDPGVVCLTYGACALWLLGYADQALKKSQQAIVLSQELSHPLSLAFAHCLAARLHQLRREGPAAQKQAEAALAIATEQGLPLFLGLATFLRGWALAEQGQTEVGIGQMHQGMAAYRATGAQMGQPYFLGLLAEAYGKERQGEKGLSLLAEALNAAENSGQGFMKANLCRLKGELLQMRGPEAEVEASSQQVEACFLRAVTIAQQQEAKSWELRAVMSLSRLWHSQGSQGKQTQAFQMLSEIYNWFTEGFDTIDLKEATALLEELS